MKHLKITYGEAVLWDAPVGSLEWHDSENGVKIDGRVNVRPASSPTARGGGILDMLAKASKAKTSQAADEKREAYEKAKAGYEAAVGSIHDGLVEPNEVGVETVEPELEDSA